MKNFYFIIFFFLSAFGGNSYAVINPTTQSTPTYYHDGPSNDANLTSVQAAFDSMVGPMLAAGWKVCADYAGNPMSNCQPISGSAWSFDLSLSYQSQARTVCEYLPNNSYNYCYSRTIYMSKENITSCPANSVLTGSSCTCSSGYVESGNSCIVPVLPDPCVDLTGTSSGRITAPYSGGGLNTNMTNLCEPLPATSGNTKFPGCSITVEYDFASGGEKSGSGTYGPGCTPGTGDGSSPATPKTSSTETTPIEGAPAPTPCKQGYATGTVNGKSVCVAPVPGSDTVSIDKKKVTATDEAGNTLNGTQEKTTTCKDGTCTTTTTVTNITTNINGSSTTTTTSSGSTESQDSFCRENPNARQCDGQAADGQDDDGEGGGGGLPDSPKLYEPKYPDGLSGVWQEKKSAMTSTPLFTLADRLMPTIGAGGTCPSWQMSFDLGIGDMGSHNVAPPCWIWSVAKAIVIVSALLLARALIFGG